MTYDHGRDFLRPRIELALAEAGHTHTFDQAMQRVRDQRAELFVSPDQRGAIVAEIIHYPAFKTINYWLVAGALDAVLAMQPRVEDFGRDNGCKYAAALGRGGWSRVLPAYGWTTAGTAYRKVI